MLLPFVYIDSIKDKGRGVFTRKKIAAGTVIETAPVIVMNNEDRKLLDQTLLHDFIFLFGAKTKTSVVWLWDTYPFTIILTKVTANTLWITMITLCSLKP